MTKSRLCRAPAPAPAPPHGRDTPVAGAPRHKVAVVGVPWSCSGTVGTMSANTAGAAGAGTRVPCPAAVTVTSTAATAGAQGWDKGTLGAWMSQPGPCCPHGAERGASSCGAQHSSAVTGVWGQSCEGHPLPALSPSRWWQRHGGTRAQGRMGGGVPGYTGYGGPWGCRWRPAPGVTGGDWGAGGAGGPCDCGGPAAAGGPGGSRRSPSGAGGSRGSRRSRPLAGPRCAGGGASGAVVPHPSSPVPCSQWEGGGREGSAPRSFKAAPRARRRQRRERPPGRRLPPPCTDRPGPAPARPAPVSPASSGAAAPALPSPRGRGLVGRRPTGGRGLCWAPGGSGRGGGGASGARWASAGPRGTQGRLLAPGDRVSARPRLQAGHPGPAPRSRPRLGVGCALLPPGPWLSQGVPGHPPPGLVTRPRPGWGDSTAAGRDKGAGRALGALSLPILPWDAPGSGLGTSAWCCSRHGEGERCGRGCLRQPWPGVCDSPLPAEGIQDPHRTGTVLGLIP